MEFILTERFSGLLVSGIARVSNALQTSVGSPTRTLSCSNGLHDGCALVGLPRLQHTRLAEYGFDLSSHLL